eukprot:6485360-Amphidinium_carterae.1
MQSSAGQDKPRIIDDYTVNGQNLTVGATERLDHGGVDEFIALTRHLGMAILHGLVRIHCLDGSCVDVRVHPAWRDHGIRARTLDLRSAYKQLAVREDDLDVAITCCYHPSLAQPAFWKNYALPFGSAASVYGFNRCSRALEVMLASFGCVLCSSYFDDFQLLDMTCTVGSSSSLAESALKALGWTFDDRDHKYVEFTDKLSLLG